MAKLDTSTDPQVGYRPPGDLDPATALARYDGPFARRQAAHLLRRAGFGGTPDQIDALASLGMGGAVDSLLHPAAPEPDFQDFPATDALYDPKRRTAAAQLWWLDRMLRTKRPLVEKMTLFWHGHFATSIRKVEPRLMVAQINLFRSQALGNFRTLLLSVSRDPAMLIWLDNRYNTKAHPNENYAREVMELFSLGLGNYSEDDIKESARAFTGWSLDKQTAFVFNQNQHDNGEKTFLGRTGDFDGTDIVNTIVSQPIHQRFICRKLLQFFVYSDPEPELIEKLAAVYAVSGYDLAKTVGTILRSNVFYSARAYRAVPKSPIEFGVGLLRYLGYGAVPADTPSWFGRMGQEPLAPPSVKGWDGGPEWISTATLLARFNYVNRVVNAQPPKPAAATMSAPGAVPAAAAAYPSVSPDAIVARAGGMDAQRILEWIVTGSIQDDLTGDLRSGLLTYLSSGDAANPMPLGGENYQQKIRGTLALVLNLPSNQLN
jgi:hypothetical protein